MLETSRLKGVDVVVLAVVIKDDPDLELRVVGSEVVLENPIATASGSTP